MNQLQPGIAAKVLIFAPVLIHCVLKSTCCAMWLLMNDCDSDGVLVHWALPTDFFWPSIGSCETCGSVLISAGFTQKHNRQIEEHVEQIYISLLQPVLALSEVSYYGSWLLYVSSLLMSCVPDQDMTMCTMYDA